MERVDWQRIEVFLRVAEEGSFTRAAQVLGTSQPTVSRHVHALEEELGITLFARHARGFDLTDQGEALLESARQVDAGVQTFVRRASGLTSQLGGAVRISASEPVAAYHLTRFVARFRREHPTVEIELLAESRSSDLMRREADIAVRMFRPRQLDLIARRVGEIPVGLFAHRDYLDRYGTPGAPDELCEHVLIGYDADPTGFESLAEYGIGRDDFSLRTDSLVTQLEAILAGVGVGGAQVPLMAQHAEVLPVLGELSLPALPLWLAVHRDLRHSPAISAVFDGLAAFLSQPEGPSYSQ